GGKASPRAHVALATWRKPHIQDTPRCAKTTAGDGELSRTGRVRATHWMKSRTERVRAAGTLLVGLGLAVREDREPLTDLEGGPAQLIPRLERGHGRVE